MQHIREGKRALRPYTFVRLDMIDFIQNVFDAQITARYDTPGGAHVEALIQDSALILECADKFPDHVSATVSSLYLYVPDVDATYEKALVHGASSISPPEDKPYDERQCGIADSFGNTWWISTFTGSEA